MLACIRCFISKVTTPIVGLTPPDMHRQLIASSSSSHTSRQIGLQKSRHLFTHWIRSLNATGSLMRG